NGNGNVVAARAEARPRRRDVAYLQTQLLIPQKEEAVIQLQDEEFDLMVVVDCEEIEEVNANCILMANLHEIFNMFAQEEQYTELLEPTTDTYLMQHDDSNVILVDSIMDPSGGDSDKNPATIEEHMLSMSHYIIIWSFKIKKDNTVNPETREANEKLTDEHAIYKSQEKMF
ncbi:hypothetical protein Tco_1206894, partial [Tanacetum coccineum]